MDRDAHGQRRAVPDEPSRLRRRPRRSQSVVAPGGHAAPEWIKNLLVFAGLLFSGS